MDKKDPFVLRHLADVQPELWWLDSDPLEPAPHSALIGDIGADLCVVGAGYTGLWTALLAKERDPDREVVVVEQYETGAGASGRNGGFCSASLTHGYLNGVRRFPDEIELIQRLGRENLDEIEATIARYSIECDFERTGELQVAVAPWQFKGMAEQAERRNAMGDAVEVLSSGRGAGARALPFVRRGALRPRRHGAGRPGTSGVGPRARLHRARREDLRELQGRVARGPSRRGAGPHPLRRRHGRARRARHERLPVAA